MTIIFASNNAKKLQELRAILSEFEVQSYRVFLEPLEVVETGASFSENAHLKARAIYDRLPHKNDLCVLADDSGLCVDALNGMPGIFSARFANISENAHQIAQGHFATPQKDSEDTSNNLKLLACLKELGISQSKASFVCVMALCMRVGGVLQEKSFRGECKGKICQAPLNPKAFGYDPLFIPKGHTLTMDQIPEKNTLSHRFLALQQCKEFLKLYS
ncbi:non-canonical purine NTP pyrophosphatase [Helicobacter mehlei]|uniref:dITP/XTP pyrophosphatase n=1 Tax=Helicobacter mehlei TaxID=2316080 RepID=A0A553V3E5_9HELI|nr:non-canonical purine NTP pyrophosphatase [Helicobacter mehlei]TSA86962.1 non-canonical purine NTP pyrophosphatase [Helicobacter mehlei]